MVKELMEGETGKEVRKNAEEYGEIAKKAMEEGSGSSWRNLDVLVDALCNPRNPWNDNKVFIAFCSHSEDDFTFDRETDHI
ncbi:hypothetical protein POTOM_006271 [Populus tomentosa]|uniref:Uncharacterized protein n=1 Tax=Populus tomentosa TaxID=118781 RepID=A0A8X8AKP1_POPTO|nr:hypothetical protein POTOM_006271 [Populus tomentosa]